MTAAMAEVIFPLSGNDSDAAMIFARKWRTGVPEAIQQADQFLAETGGSMATVDAAAFALALPVISQIDGMIAANEKCRDGAVWRIERYLASAAQRAALELGNKSTHSGE
jgi:hypothetical protein